jgi:hypothetical protein
VDQVFRRAGAERTSIYETGQAKREKMPGPAIRARPLTNAERQAAYKARKKVEGLKRRDNWIDPMAAQDKEARRKKAG